jgi:hypothetical protein
MGHDIETRPLVVLRRRQQRMPSDGVPRGRVTHGADGTVPICFRENRLFFRIDSVFPNI